MDFSPYIARFKQRFGEVEAELGNSSTFSNPRRASELGREHARLKSLLEAADRYVKVQQEIADNEALLAAEENDSEMGLMVQADLDRLQNEKSRLELQLQAGILPPDPNDSRNTIMEIRSGAGGNEASLFVADLFRMYARYSESQGWKVETLDASPSDLGGYREIVLSVTGTDVYKKMRYESGVHRVQRVPATEANGRIHTSTATVAVLPEAEEVDVEIKPEELEISVCRASGPGGQGVNTTDSAVQILHKPTGLIVRCADERSQLKNKAKALRVLRSRLLEARQAEEHEKYAANRKSQIGTGERNERIRTYNFPQNRITDHRINLTIHNLPDILEGRLEELIEPLAIHDLQQKLAEVR